MQAPSVLLNACNRRSALQLDYMPFFRQAGKYFSVLANFPSELLKQCGPHSQEFLRAHCPASRPSLSLDFYKANGGTAGWIQLIDATL